MIYIIPAWYYQNQWMENEHKWYVPRAHTEMDDSVKQIQLFHRQSIAEYKVLVLGFAPNFRHFLHRQAIFHAPYWSCFDAIQCIETKQQNIISFHDMEWPEEAEFIYSPFAIVVMLHDEKYALIEFGDDGNLIEIDSFKNDTITRRLRFDDRGFIGSVTQFKNDGTSEEYFLDSAGNWKMCVSSEGRVRINPERAYYLIEKGDERTPYEYSAMEYESVDCVIEEVLKRYIQAVEGDDIFCLAMHPLHSGVLSKVLKGKRTILSFWESRGLPQANEENCALVQDARYIIAGTEEALANISSTYGAFSAKMKEMSPYDVRVDLGTSRQVSEQRILIPIDALSDDTLACAIVIAARYCKENPSARVHLFTRNSNCNYRDQVLSKVRQVLRDSGFDPRAAVESGVNTSESSKDETISQAGELAAIGELPDDYGDDYDDAVAEKIIKSLFVLEQCVDEMAINNCLRTVSLYVDLATTPDLFLQIQCVSMCIPQVVFSATRYIEDGGNGTIISDISELGEHLHYYLDNLGNWNAAMARSYEIGQRFTTSKLVERWKGVLEESGGN